MELIIVLAVLLVCTPFFLMVAVALAVKRDAKREARR
jgi:hypothetical protein